MNKKINYEKVRYYHLKGLSQNKIAQKLGCNQTSVSVILKKLGLKSNFHKFQCTVSDKRVYSENRINKLSYEEIAKKYDLTVPYVKIKIGKHLMSLCRKEKACPYKALLPEYDVV